MARKNIYEIIAENGFNAQDEFERLSFLLNHDYFVLIRYATRRKTIRQYVNDALFDYLPIKNTFMRLDDLTDELGLDMNTEHPHTMEDVLNLAELMLCIAETASDHPGIGNITAESEDIMIRKIITHIRALLEKCSHEIIEDNGRHVIIPINAEAEQAAQVCNNEKISLEILCYNHRSNNGNLEAKKTVLAKIYKYLEPNCRSDNSDLGRDIRFIVNNLDIRHNNTDGEGANCQYMRNLTPETQEEWYDCCYNLMVAYIILQEAEKIHDKIRKLTKQGTK